MIKTAPGDIYNEYEAGMLYDTQLELPANIKRNHNFLIGKQWEGVNAKDLDKPVVNIIRRISDYTASMIVSDNITVQCTVVGDGSEEARNLERAVNRQYEMMQERTKFNSVNRRIVRNSHVEGDAYLYIYFDPEVETGQLVKGEIAIEPHSVLDVYFGNTEEEDVQKQPYIIIAMRQMVDAVKQEAKKNDIADYDSIVGDTDGRQTNSEYETGDKVTVLLKMWKERGTVHMIKVTRTAVVQNQWDTGYKLYPLAKFPWERMENSCRGRGLVEEIIPNQIYINKMRAMAMRSTMNNAFPTIVYDETKLSEWNNEPGTAIGVPGSPNEAVAVPQGVGNMSPQVEQMIQSIMKDTMEVMGATDAALGNVRPDNTSAIIAVQKASIAPLELHRQDFYQYVEDVMRVMLDLMRQHFGERFVEYVPDEDEPEMPLLPDGVPFMVDATEGSEQNGKYFDFHTLEGKLVNLRVNVGQAAYWSELMQVQTLDNMYNKKIISADEYLEQMPDEYIPKKSKILAKRKRLKEAQAVPAAPASEAVAGGQPIPPDIARLMEAQGGMP